MSSNATHIIRNSYDIYTQFSQLNEINDPNVLYNGATTPDEDPADYYPRGITVRAVRLG